MVEEKNRKIPVPLRHLRRESPATLSLSPSPPSPQKRRVRGSRECEWRLSPATAGLEDPVDMPVAASACTNPFEASLCNLCCRSSIWRPPAQTLDAGGPCEGS